MEGPTRIHLLVSGTFSEMVRQRHAVMPYAGLALLGRFRRGRGVWQELAAPEETLRTIYADAINCVLDAVTANERIARIIGASRIGMALRDAHERPRCRCGHDKAIHWAEGGGAHDACLSGRGTAAACACDHYVAKED